MSKESFLKVSETMTRFLSENGSALHMTGEPSEVQPSLKSVTSLCASESTLPSELTLCHAQIPPTISSPRG